MKKILAILIMLPLVVSCGTYVGDEKTVIKPRQFIEIFGTKKGYYADEATITKDIKISNLRIRQTKLLNQSKGCKEGYRYIIELNGEINSDATYAIEQIIDDTPSCTSVSNGELIPTLLYLNSNGGSLNDGVAIGKIFRSKYKKIAAIIDDGQVCASACAIAFLGAASKMMGENGTLLFHSPYKADLFGIDCASKTDMNELRKYMVEMLSFRGGAIIGERVFERMMSFCSKSGGWTLNRDAAKIFKILL
jgi:ATP-dependent protease ClpP protease subunit